MWGFARFARSPIIILLLVLTKVLLHKSVILIAFGTLANLSMPFLKCTCGRGRGHVEVHMWLQYNLIAKLQFSSLLAKLGLQFNHLALI